MVRRIRRSEFWQWKFCQSFRVTFISRIFVNLTAALATGLAPPYSLGIYLRDLIFKRIEPVECSACAFLGGAFFFGHVFWSLSPINTIPPALQSIGGLDKLGELNFSGYSTSVRLCYYMRRAS